MRGRKGAREGVMNGGRDRWREGGRDAGREGGRSCSLHQDHSADSAVVLLPPQASGEAFSKKRVSKMAAKAHANAVVGCSCHGTNGPEALLLRQPRESGVASWKRG